MAQDRSQRHAATTSQREMQWLILGTMDDWQKAREEAGLLMMVGLDAGMARAEMDGWRERVVDFLAALVLYAEITGKQRSELPAMCAIANAAGLVPIAQALAASGNVEPSAVLLDVARGSAGDRFVIMGTAEDLLRNIGE